MNYASRFYSAPSRNTQDTLVDLELVDEVISGITLVNSMIDIVNSLEYQEYSEELVAVLRDYVGRFLEALAVEGTYIPGLASLLSSKIEKHLWEIDSSDRSLAEFLNMIVGYRISLVKGEVGIEDSEELISLTCRYLHISFCEELEQKLQPLTPPLALQVALTSLAISVGGLGV
ncbi:MAG: hypothetical protein RMI56_06165 [Sulfolobales archaeon]|nr:hypothetical protein [Sulfolobales archaeon]MDW8083361.1 hypothetical protein [Sulfolobales archaeon]